MAATEKVGIEIELLGGEEALALLKRIDGSIDTLNKKRKFKSLSGLKSAKGELEGYISELQKLQKEEKKWQDLAKRVGKENMSAFGVREWDRVKGKIDETNGKIEQMSAEMDEVTIKTKTFGQMFKSAASSVAHVGSAMQSLGNAMVRLTSPFRRLTSGLLMGAGYKALNLFTEGLSNVFTRSDTMKNYDRSLKALGLDTKQTFKVFKEAKTAKDNLDEAVQGLPTSLDEIMAAQKVYAGATGEMVDSTKTAIAANNTFLASGMDAREQRFMQRYLVAMASGAELTKVQWQSMARIAPLAMRAVSKELGYADDEYAQFTKDVQSGTVAGQEFLKAFQKVGISGAVADAARVQTESWAGLSSNIKIAVTRAGQAVIDTLNDTFKDATGRTLLQRLLGIDANGKKMGDGIRDWINDISESVQRWIKSHPDELVDFFNDLKSIDWKGLAKGLGEGALEFARIISAFAKWASGKDLSKLGRWMPRINILGNGLLVFGGFLKGTRHIWGGLWAIMQYKFAGKGGFFGKLVDIFGKKKDVTTAGEVGGAISSASPKLISAFKNMALLSGIVAAPFATGFVVTAATKGAIKNFKDTIDLLKEINWKDAKKVLLGIGGFLGGSVLASTGLGALASTGAGSSLVAFTILGEVIGGLMTSIATGFFDLDMAFIKGGVKNFSDALKYLNEAMAEIDKLPEIENLTTVSDKVAQVREAMWTIAKALEGQSGSPKDRGVVQKGVPTLSSGQTRGIKNIADAIKSLQDFITNINGLAVMGINQSAVSKVRQVGRTIEDVVDALPSALKNKNASYGDMAGNIKNLNKALKSMSTMASRINNLAGMDVNTSGFGAFVDSIRAALEDFKSLSGELMLDIEVKLSPIFGSSVEGVKRSIKREKKAIEAFKAPISYTIPVSIMFNVSTNAIDAIRKIREARATVRHAREGGSQQMYEATGGLIYRARGGGIPWKRRGTDTVPAMLTPGEYVHNKRAVNTFGIDFMRKVNNLDVKGAMNELMHRAGNMANVNRGSVVNNTYNNNQKVIINNNSAGAGFTFKRASRFVGAI